MGMGCTHELSQPPGLPELPPGVPKLGAQTNAGPESPELPELPELPDWVGPEAVAEPVSPELASPDWASV